MADHEALFNPAAPEPPHLRPSEGGSACSGCTMFDAANSVCWGYGNWPVKPTLDCDSFSPLDAEQPEAAEVPERFLAPPPVIIPDGTSPAKRIELRYGAFGPPKGSDDDLRKRMAAGDPQARKEILERSNG